MIPSIRTGQYIENDLQFWVNFSHPMWPHLFNTNFSSYFLCLSHLHFSPPSRYNAQYLDQSTLNNHQDSSITSIGETQNAKEQPSRACPFYARLVSNERVTASDHFQDVRLVQFDIADSGIWYVRILFVSFFSEGVWFFAYAIECSVSNTHVHQKKFVLETFGKKS